MSFYDDASLVVIPSAQKTSKLYAVKPTDGSGDLTFTRTGDTATRVNSAGLIERVRTNLALRSQSFATAAVWATSNGTITNNAGTAPDGTNTASKIVATNSDPFVYQALTLSGSVVASCYVKGIGSSIGKGGSIRAASTVTNFTITGDWQRVSVAHTAGGAQNYGVETPESAAVSDEVLLWGFQVETGDIATAYIPTTTAAVSVGPTANTARLDYLGSTCPRLILEGQRTNLLTYSEQMDNAAYTKVDVTVSANATTSPDGNINADAVLEVASTGTHEGWQRANMTSGQVYTQSVFVKANGRKRVQLQIFDSSTLYAAAIYDLNTGTVVATNGVSTITSFGNGWYRCTISGTSPSTSFGYCVFGLATDNYNVVNIQDSYAGDVSKGAFFYGWQLEAGAYATSYIPTLAASATRGADACSKTGISSLIGQTEGVLFVDWNYENKTDSNGSIPIILTGSVGEAYIFVSGAGTLLGELYNSGLQVSIAGAIGSAGRKKIAFAYKQNDFVLYLNGVQIGTDTSGTVGSLTGLFVGSYYTSGYSSNTGINQALLFKTRLTNAQLAELTTL